MTRKTKGWIGAVLFLSWVGVFCATSYGEEAAVDGWQVGFAGSDDLISGRLLYRTGGRVKVGGDVSWLDGIDAGDEGWRMAFVATYDIVDDATLKVPLLSGLPANWYIGGLAGPVVPTEGSNKGEWDATAALLTGLTLGKETATLGIEYQFLLTDELWGQLADIPNEHRLLFTAAIRF
jgi:hypothetical protein